MINKESKKKKRLNQDFNKRKRLFNRKKLKRLFG